MCAHGQRALHRESGSPARQRAELAAAGHLGDEASARAGLGSEDPALRATALGALSRLRALELSDLAAGLVDPAPAVRRRAAELSFSVSFEPEAVTALLLPRLGDESEVVEAACTALGEIGRGEAVEELGAVALGHEDPLCREAAIAALGGIGHSDGLGYILAGLSDRPAVRRRAVIALSAFEGPSVDQALQGALSDRDWQVRQAAEDLTTNRP